MKALILAFTLAMIATASAQVLPQPWPKTTKLTSKANGQQIGTATQWGNKVVLRDLKGEPIGTIVLATDRTRTFFDANGKQVDELSLEPPPLQ
jgi:hypothetical protein